MDFLKVFIIFLSLISFVLSQQCTMGQNCPYNQGICAGNVCECLDGYKTRYNPKLTQEQQIMCNYKQISHFVPLILEIFLPGIGHFYVGKYFLGFIKLILALVCIGSSLYIYNEIRIPNYITALGRTILNQIIGEKPLQNMDGGLTPLELAQICFNITFHPFWIFWAFDIYMYFTKTYYDGNRMPLY